MKPDLQLFDFAPRNLPNQSAAPNLLIKLDPWHSVFLRNLRDLFWPNRLPPSLWPSPPDRFWNDVFVKSRLPWRRFLDSAILHTTVIVVLWGSAHLWPQRPHLTSSITVHSSDVISYELSEYLPPLNTGHSSAATSHPGDPLYAPQPIISVPPEADNHQQTIVTLPQLKLNRDLPLPNIVAWEPRVPIISPPAVTRHLSDPRAPVSSELVITPPPEVSRNRMNPTPALPSPVVAPAPEIAAVKSSREARIPQNAVAPPPPGVEMAALRQSSDLNIAPGEVVAPAPDLPLQEQHAIANLGATVVPPPPSVQVSGTPADDQRLIALSIHPAPPAGDIAVPSGNRRGAFAATPRGNSAAKGIPESLPANGNADAAAIRPESSQSLDGVPPGLFVGPQPGVRLNSLTDNASGADPKSAPVDPEVTARATSPRVLAAETSPEQQSEVEREVFGIRKSYAMTVNIPNLNSAGGSLVMHFSELKEGEKKGDLLAPVVTRAVAPGYPLELMRQNVQGTVELTAVIDSNGSVSDVQVLNSVDERLQDYARNALLRWQFLPAVRNGKPVPLQAVVRIPFKPRAVRF